MSWSCPIRKRGTNYPKLANSLLVSRPAPGFGENKGSKQNWTVAALQRPPGHSPRRPGWAAPAWAGTRRHSGSLAASCLPAVSCSWWAAPQRWGLLSRHVSGSLHPMYLLKRRERQCPASVGTGSSSRVMRCLKTRTLPTVIHFPGPVNVSTSITAQTRQHQPFKQLESPRRVP